MDLSSDSLYSAESGSSSINWIQAGDMISRRFLARPALLIICSALLLLSVNSALSQWAIPDELQTQASALNDEQTEFITSGAILNFIPGGSSNTNSPAVMRTVCDP